MNIITKTLSVSLFTLLFASTVFAEEGFNEQQKKQIGDIVHDYIIKNPEVIKEAIIALQKNEMQGMVNKAKEVAFSEKESLFSTSAPNAGADKPKEVVVMFSDYQCSHCKNASNAVDKLLDSNKELKVIFKELPIFGDDSVLAAKAALAADKQGQYKAFHQKLMDLNSPPSEDAIMKIAKELKLDIKKLKSDMALPEFEEQLKANIALAQKLGLRGTPAFFISSYPVLSSEKIIFIPGEANVTQLQDSLNKTK